MRVLWYTKFLKDDFDRNDIVIYRINPYYDLENLRENILSSLDFYQNLETDRDLYSVKDSSMYTTTEEEY